MNRMAYLLIVMFAFQPDLPARDSEKPCIEALRDEEIRAEAALSAKTNKPAYKWAEKFLEKFTCAGKLSEDDKELYERLAVVATEISEIAEDRRGTQPMRRTLFLKAIADGLVAFGESAEKQREEVRTSCYSTMVSKDAIWTTCTSR